MPIIMPSPIQDKRDFIVKDGKKYYEEIPTTKKEIGFGLLFLLLILVWVILFMYFLTYGEKTILGLTIFFTPIVIGIIYCFL